MGTYYCLNIGLLFQGIFPQLRNNPPETSNDNQGLMDHDGPIDRRRQSGYGDMTAHPVTGGRYRTVGSRW